MLSLLISDICTVVNKPHTVPSVTSAECSLLPLTSDRAEDAHSHARDAQDLSTLGLNLIY